MKQHGVSVYYMGLDGEGTSSGQQSTSLLYLWGESYKRQLGLDEVAWNSLYFVIMTARCVKTWDDESDEFQRFLQECTATCLHMMQGTLYIRVRLGMTNTVFRVYASETLSQSMHIGAYRERTVY